MKRMYAAEMTRFGSVTLTSVQVEKETKLQYRVSREGQQRIVGGGLYRRVIAKNEHDVQMFKTLPEAIKYLIEEGNKLIGRLKNEVSDIEKTIASLQSIQDASALSGDNDATP